MTEPTQTRPTDAFTLNVHFMFKGPWGALWVEESGITCNTGTPIVGEALKELDEEHVERIRQALERGPAHLAPVMDAWRDATLAKLHAHVEAAAPANRTIEKIMKDLDLPYGQTMTLVVSPRNGFLPAIDRFFLDGMAETMQAIAKADATPALKP